MKLSPVISESVDAMPPGTPPSQLQSVDRMLNVDDVSVLVRKSRSWIYSRVKADKFAKPIRLSARCTLWRYSDVAAWIAQAGKDAQ